MAAWHCVLDTIEGDHIPVRLSHLTYFCRSTYRWRIRRITLLGTTEFIEPSQSVWIFTSVQLSALARDVYDGN